ncbi:DUF4340 domain-containing protein [bacterium]|nr:DUF4340 domain-containing protein [bacterium]
MIRKQTTFLWITALGLSGIILIFESPWNQKSAGPLEQRSLLPASQMSRWENLSIHSDKSQLEFKRDGSSWKITQPIQDLAHPTLVSGLLDTLSQLKPKTVLTQAEIQKAGGWKTFGLEPALTTMTLARGDKSVQIKLGDRESVGNQVYIRLNEEPHAWVVDGAWLDPLPDQIEAWRDPRIVAAELKDVDHIEISHSDAHIVVDKNTDGRGWHLTLPEALKDSRANISRIETLLSKTLPTLHAQEFLTEEDAGKLQWIGLEDPVLELQLRAGEKDPIQLSWGYNVPDKPGLRYARLEGRSTIMLAPDLIFSEQLNVLSSAFRDPFLIDPAFSFNRLKLGAKEPFTLLYNADSAKWKLEDPANLPTDEMLVRRLFQNLANIQIKAYHDVVDSELQESMFGMGSYQMRFSTMTNQTESSVLEVQFSRSFDASMYAKRSDEETIYELPASLLHDLPSEPIAIRNQDLWDVSVAEITRIDIQENHVLIRLDRASNGIWLFNSDILTDPQKTFIEEFLEFISHPKTTKWMDSGEAKYERFGLDPSGDGLQMTVHFERDSSSASKRILFGRQSPRSAIYAGVDLETGPVICELSNTLPYSMRHIISWKKAADRK